MAKITPETCKHLDLLCTECPDRLACEPSAKELRGLHGGGVVELSEKELPILAEAHGETVLPKYTVPDFLKGASKSVRKSYGYQ